MAQRKGKPKAKVKSDSQIFYKLKIRNAQWRNAIKCHQILTHSIFKNFRPHKSVAQMQMPNQKKVQTKISKNNSYKLH